MRTGRTAGKDEGIVIKMIDSVRVAQDAFTHMVLMGGSAREEWNEDRNAPKMQKKNNEGVLLWRLQVAMTTPRGRGEMALVTVAAPVNPVDQLGVGTVVDFEGLVMGVSKTKTAPFFTTWFSADGVRPAGHAVKANDREMVGKGT